MITRFCRTLTANMFKVGVRDYIDHCIGRTGYQVGTLGDQVIIIHSTLLDALVCNHTLARIPTAPESRLQHLGKKLMSANAHHG